MCGSPSRWLRGVCQVACAIIFFTLTTGGTTAVLAWSPQGHRLAALVAERRLTPEARDTAATLLEGRSLADVAVWADDYAFEAAQALFWHFVNIPAAANTYDRTAIVMRQGFGRAHRSGGIR